MPAAQAEMTQDIIDVSTLTQQQINYKTVEAAGTPSAVFASAAFAAAFGEVSA